MLRIAVNLLVHAPNDGIGAIVTKASKIAVRSLLDSDIAQHDLRLTVIAIDCQHPDFEQWRRQLTSPSWEAESRAPCHIEFIPSGKVSYSQARNLAYKSISYDDPSWDLFVEIDSDNVFPSSWFSALRNMMLQYPRAGIFSPGTIQSDYWKAGPDPTLDIDYAEQSEEHIRQTVNEKAEALVSVYGGTVGNIRHMPVLKLAWCQREIGLYDEAFEGSLWEDWDEIMRAISAGWEVRTFLDSFVFHWMAWEKMLLKGWHGRDADKDHRENRKRFFDKWPGAEEFYFHYTRERGQLYRRTA